MFAKTLCKYQHEYWRKLWHVVFGPKMLADSSLRSELFVRSCREIKWGEVLFFHHGAGGLSQCERFCKYHPFLPLPLNTL